jgi:uncharacterized protein YukJ
MMTLWPIMDQKGERLGFPLLSGQHCIHMNDGNDARIRRVDKRIRQ